MTAVNSTMLALGTRAPDFELVDPAGATWSLDDVTGAPALVVAFLSNHCPYVKLIASVLGDVAGELTAAGASVVGIMSNDVDAYPADSPAEMATFAKESGWDFPYLYDADQSVAHAYRAACTPDFYVFDGDLSLRYRGQFDGARPSNDITPTGADLRAAVLAVLARGEVAGDQRASMGCNIKWRPGNEPEWFA